MKDPISASVVETLLIEANAELVLNGTGFAVSTPGKATVASPLNATDAPVFQIVFSGGNEADWRDTTRGLSARDIAMNVALPEVDGRILSRAVSFKGEARFDEATQCPLVVYEPLADRIEFVAKLAASWLRLRRTPRDERRVAVIMANYPNRDGRLGNGVGLDTPASVIELLTRMSADGYLIDNAPRDGAELIERIQRGPTNAAIDGREITITLSGADYQKFFERLPEQVRSAVTDRWGAPDADPFYLESTDAFALSAFLCGNVVIGLQPARGYNIDPQASYHDPDLVPPHGYFAFYAWLRDIQDVHAIVHMGKHGNLEWLPGKALALSDACYPEAVFGPMPHLYPFIVNDPGEGTQAKRRSQAVIVDHLTPPLTRAETYGPLAELELLVDEYFEAAGVDPRRLVVLRDEILQLATHVGLDRDCGIVTADDHDTALAKLDNYLCELKEMQIRGGLHIFGCSPRDETLTDLLVSMVRLPRSESHPGDASLTRALARDLELTDFDPLDCVLGEPWNGNRPVALRSSAVWRTCGDTVERLEELAKALIDGTRQCETSWSRARSVLDFVENELLPNVNASGALELDAMDIALDGRFLKPGPSGAPTRGRLDVLPTGRNFYSVDTRTVPTPAAWKLGWKSAALLLERYRQEHGAWPENLALSAWGNREHAHRR